jgi:hypothetical protein
MLRDELQVVLPHKLQVASPSLRTLPTRCANGQGEKGPGVGATFVAGGLAGIANWCAMLPIDTVKSRYQVPSLKLLRISVST